MTHDRCSEVLPAYVREELQPELAGEVRAHLTGCADCRAEERAVRALAHAGGPDARPLDDVERARLHRGIAQEVFTARANADVAGAGAGGRVGLKRWIVPVAAAAAVLAAAAVTTLGGGLGGSDSETALAPAGEAEGGGGDAVEDSDSRTSESAMESKAGRGRGARGAVSAHGAAGAEANLAGPDQPTPTFDPDRRALSPAELADIGRSHRFQSFANAYGPDDGVALYDPFLAMIENDASDAGPRIQECAQTLPQDGSLIPAYGTVAQYRDENVLVLGFVTHDPGSARLNRSLLWVWDIDSCEQPVDTLFQKIGPR